MNSIKCYCIGCKNCPETGTVRVNREELEVLIKKCNYYEKSYMDLKSCIEEFVEANSDSNGKFASSKIIQSITTSLPALMTGNQNGINKLMDKIKLQNLITKGADLIKQDSEQKPWEDAE
jgi:excinuclease UvrABC ATPase subunit